MRVGRVLTASMVCAAIALAGAVGASGAVHKARHKPRAARAASGAIGFSTPSIVDPISTFGEPTIAIDPVGNDVFASGPTGTGVQRSQWEASSDGGQSFRIMTPAVPPTAVQSTEDPPGGGDTDLNFDRSGKQYFADLYALACLRTATSTNTGEDIQTSPDGCGTYPPADRQWLSVYDPPPNIPHESAYVGPTPLVYLEYNNLVSGAQWNRSNDGLTFTSAISGETPGSNANYAPFGADGYPQLDQQTGKVFQSAGLQNPDGTFDLLLNIGTPDSQGNLTFLDAPTATSAGAGNTGNLIHIANNLPGSPDTLFVVLSFDTARNLFVSYTVTGSKPSQWQTYVSAASAASGWRTWTNPVQVSDGSTATGDAVNVFPWIKAGGPGRADAVWYGSNVSADPSSDQKQAWNVFMGQTVFPVDRTGAITGAAPTTTLVKASPHPMHYQDVCQAGTGCITVQGNRNLADFFSLTINKQGAAQIIYDDTSNGLSQQGFEPTGNQTVDHAGAPLVTIAHQTSGLGLYGKPVSGASSAPTSGISDPSGDARYPAIGGSEVAGTDLLGTSAKLNSSAKTLTITDKVLDLSNPAASAAQIPGGGLLQYVTRWQMGNTIYYAAMSNTAANQPMYYAGAAQSVDLCSVSACYPHALTYPEANLGGTAETGAVKCPTTPSVSAPCTLTITVNTADVGNPTSASSLEEIGTYTFSASHPQGLTSDAQAQADNLPLEIDGACCFNYGAPISASSVAGAGVPRTALGGPLTATGRGYSFGSAKATPGTEPALWVW
jgi:hypothetical protein